METVSYTKIRGSSEKTYSSDALDFYEDYWMSGTDLDPNNINCRRDILKTIFPSGIINKRIAELGLGGEGGFLYLLRDQNEVFGFDASESAALICQKFGIKVNVQNLDFDRLPLPDNSIDLLFAMEVFEHFASPQFVVEEIRRVLAPTGLVVISTPNPLIYHWPRLFYPELFYENVFKDFLMINNFSIQEIHRFGDLPISSTSVENTAWSFIWVCNKLNMNDAKAVFNHGLHFWSKKLNNGLRKKPIEAIDYFRLCSKLNPSDSQYQFYLTRALVYRFINGEMDEFAAHYNNLTAMIADGEPAEKRSALYHLAMIYLELESMGRQKMNKETFDEALQHLGELPDSGSYIRRIEMAMESIY